MENHHFFNGRHPPGFPNISRQKWPLRWTTATSFGLQMRQENHVSDVIQQVAKGEYVIYEYGNKYLLYYTLVFSIPFMQMYSQIEFRNF